MKPRSTRTGARPAVTGGIVGGVHTILYSRKPEEVRAFFRDVLGLASVDAGDGWLIFAAPPGEIAVHPTDGAARHELYLMCSDVTAAVRRLEERGARMAGPITDQRWGMLARVRLPDGKLLGLYEPRHPTAVRMRGTPRPSGKKRAAAAKQGSAGKKRAAAAKKRGSAKRTRGG